MQWPAANTPVPSIRSFETRILSVGLPASILIACLLGFETLLGPKGSYVALAVLPAAPIGMAIAFLLRYKGSPIRRFVLFLACYLALEWAAEIYYVSYWINHQADPKIPSVADAFWLLSYPVLIVGCWSVAAERRGLRLAVRDAFTHGVWLVAAATSLVWITRALVVSATGTTEAVVLGIYPFADALVISLVLIIRARHNGEPTRLFWSVLLFGNAAVLLGDAGWLLSKTSTQYTDVLSKWGDVFYIAAYLLIAIGLWTAAQLEHARTDEEESTKIQFRLKYGTFEGLSNVVATAPVFASLALIAFEKSVEQGVLDKTIPPFLSGPMSFTVAVVFSCVIHWAFRGVAQRVEAVAIYREAFLKRIDDDHGNDLQTAVFLDDLRVTLRMSSNKVRTIETRLLVEREDRARARLEAERRRNDEQRSAKEWEATRAERLRSIRALDAQHKESGRAETAEKI